MAPVYPGAVPGGEPGVYLSSDPPEQVRSFYEARLGPATRADPDHHVVLGPGLSPDSGAVYWTVVTRDEALVITGEPLNEALQTTAAGVVVEGPGPAVDRPPADEWGRVPVVGDYFASLEHLTRVSSLQASDVDPLVERYLPLARLHYRRVQDDDGALVSYYERQHRECSERATQGRVLSDVQGASESDLDAMAAKVEKLYAEGKIQEAMDLQMKLSEQAMASVMAEAAEEDGGLPTVSSGDVLQATASCLAELEGEGRPTRIQISTHPTEWKLDRWW